MRPPVLARTACARLTRTTLWSMTTMSVKRTLSWDSVYPVSATAPSSRAQRTITRMLRPTGASHAGAWTARTSFSSGKLHPLPTRPWQALKPKTVPVTTCSLRNAESHAPERTKPSNSCKTAHLSAEQSRRPRQMLSPILYQATVQVMLRSWMTRTYTMWHSPEGASLVREPIMQCSSRAWQRLGQVPSRDALRRVRYPASGWTEKLSSWRCRACPAASATQDERKTCHSPYAENAHNDERPCAASAG
mmetsp:Transcript_11982/g.32176  ORF Transcript_11982/g.32176 Transcript_11982/m.32176 type:complete len:248 (+) Transcript_11982:348-1091(+)